MSNEGATISVTVHGRDTDTDEAVEVRGELAEIRFGDIDIPVPEPTYDELGGTVSIVVATEDGDVEVGGWGAIWEDVEAEIVRVDAISE